MLKWGQKYPEHIIERMLTEEISPQTPMEKLTLQAYGQLEALQYTPPTLRQYRATWNRLLTYADRKKQTDFNEAFGLQFLKDTYEIEILSTEPLRSNRRELVRRIQVLSDVQLHGWIRKRRPDKHWEYPKQFHALFTEVEKAAEKKGLSIRGRRSIRTHCHQFAQYLDSRGVRQFSDVSEYHVQKFILTLTPYAKATIEGILYSLKMVLSYAYENGHHPQNLSGICPKVIRPRKPNIPSAFTQNEVSALLSVVDRGSPFGKRDFAILMLAAHMGLRVGEIRALRFEHLKWETSRIEFIQPKTQNKVNLPLLQDVGWAIIDYLQYGRPKASQAKEVFVRHLAPYDAYGNDVNFAHIIEKYIREAKIKVPPGKHHGMHALRHSLASALLENNTPLPTISEIIGHVNTESTNIYLKIDMPHLKECALEVDYAG